MSNRNKKMVITSKSDDSDDLQSIVKTLVTEICSSEMFINKLTETIIQTISKKYEKKLSQLEKENADIKIKLAQQEETLKKLAKHNERLDEISRRKTIRIYGVEEINGEKCKKVVMKIFSEKLNLKNVKESKVESCFRVGDSKDNKVRPILVQFTRLDVKHTVYNCKKLLKGSGIVIREDLTREKTNILKKALQKIGNTGKVWTNNGIIYARKGEDDIRRVDTDEDLINL